MVKTGSFYLDWVESVPGRDRRTDGQTDRITIANTRLAAPAVARKNVVGLAFLHMF